MIHAAKLSESKRLQRVLAFLRQRGRSGATGREIIHGCDLTDLAAVRELRANGLTVEARSEGKTANGRQIWRYTLVEEGQQDLF